MNLFQQGKFTLSSGQSSPFKIDCDALSDEDIATLAFIVKEKIPRFRTVEGVPTGGLRLAKALEKYATPDEVGVVLIADDVYTTGGSMRKQRANRTSALGVVIFARGPVENWVMPIFQMP